MVKWDTMQTSYYRANVIKIFVILNEGFWHSDRRNVLSPGYVILEYVFILNNIVMHQLSALRFIEAEYKCLHHK